MYNYSVMSDCVDVLAGWLVTEALHCKKISHVSFTTRGQGLNYYIINKNSTASMILDLQLRNQSMMWPVISLRIEVIQIIPPMKKGNEML